MIFNFLDSLYKESWFLPALIGTIVFLVILFFIILIMAIRDAKKNKRIMELTKQNDLADAKAEVAFSSVVPQPIEVKINPVNTILNHDINEEQVHKDEDLSARFNNDFNTETEIGLNEVVVTDSLERSDNNLDEISSSLLEEYKQEHKDEVSEIGLEVKEEKNIENPFIETKVVEEEVKPEVANDQFSSVFVTPDTLPTEKKDDFDLNDIPAPQPIRVVNTSSIIDSSKSDEKKELDDIAGEVYSIRK